MGTNSSAVPGAVTEVVDGGALCAAVDLLALRFVPLSVRVAVRRGCWMRSFVDGVGGVIAGGSTLLLATVGGVVDRVRVRLVRWFGAVAAPVVCGVVAVAIVCSSPSTSSFLAATVASDPSVLAGRLLHHSGSSPSAT